jgi:hypothetical protein
MQMEQDFENARKFQLGCPVRHITAHENCVLNTPGEVTK